MKTLCAPFAFPGLKGTTGRSRQPFFPRPRAQNIMARIALILPRLSRYGGVEQFAFRLAEALAETRNSEHEVEFICARSECLPPVGVRTHIVGRPGGLKFIKMLWFLIRAEQVRKRGNYDLVISLGKTWNQDMMRVGGGPQKTFWELSEKAWPAGFSRWFKHLRRRLLPSNWLTRIIDNHQYRSGCRIICVSDAVRHWTQKAYPGIPVPEVIYNLPDLSRFTPPTPEQKLLSRIALNIDNNHVAIATATSNFALKGTGVLIRSVAMLPENVHLFIAGGRDSEPYQRLAKKLGVAGRIHFLGKVEDMPALYRAMDLFVLPSFYDACSNAVLEALACGLKVLSTTANGSSVFLPQEHVTPDPGDAEDLAARIRALIDEPAPGPFRIPDHIQAGLDAWVQVVNEECDQRTGKSGGMRERKADGTEENEGNGKKPHPSPSQDF